MKNKVDIVRELKERLPLANEKQQYMGWYLDTSFFKDYCRNGKY